MSISIKGKVTREYKGIKRQITRGGSTLTQIDYSSAPDWAGFTPWELTRENVGNYIGQGYKEKRSPKRGRRVWDFESFKYFIKLTQYFNCIHLAGGYPVEPVDIHASIRHLECLYEKLTLTEKVCHAYSLGSERVEDVLEMARIASGLSEKEFFSKWRKN